MVFNLSRQLSESIIAAMEDQNNHYAVNAETAAVVLLDVNAIDDDCYYALPVWSPADGFSLRERFVESLRNNRIYEELWHVLHSGRGVFRNFKETLRRYSDIETKWHLYKNYEMQRVVNGWYDSLREIWGLSKLNQEPEDFDDLVCKDFVFRQYDSLLDQEFISEKLDIAIGDASAYPQDVADSLRDLWREIFTGTVLKTDFGFSCLTPANDIIGCITYSQRRSIHTTVYYITCLFVLSEFRSLGIGKKLLLASLEDLKKKENAWVVLADIFVPDSILPLLERIGFKKIGAVFVLSISADFNVMS
jgi:ribosomal protein S18 acetylase RimI-like enzyme